MKLTPALRSRSLAALLSVCLVSAIFLISPGAAAGDVEWNGFGSAFYGQAFNTELRPAGLTDTSADFTDFSLFGLNVSAQMSEQLGASAQFITALKSASQRSWNLEVKWANAIYTPAPGYSVRAGRQLFPVLMASDYASVHYLLPFREIPVAVGNIVPYSGFDGVSASRDVSIGSNDHLLFTVFGGRPIYDLGVSVEDSGVSASAKDLLGGTVRFDGPGYRLRAEYSHSHATVDATKAPPALFGADTYDSELDQISAGARYDRQKFVAWTEWSMVRGQGGKDIPASPIPGTHIGGLALKSAQGAYALVGYHIGRFMPRYTFSWSEWQLGVANGRNINQILGVNYTLAPSAILKVEIETDQIPDSATNGPSTSTRPTGSLSQQSNGRAVYAGVDFIF